MDIQIRPLPEAHLAAADRIFRLAFGTFLGLPEPASFMGDADLLRPRWRTDPAGALGAYADGALVGTAFGMCWGGFGIFGPLTIHPGHWDGGIGRRLLDASMRLFAERGVRQAGLFTFPQSAKHHALYEKAGFVKQELTPLLGKAVAAAPGADIPCLSALAGQPRAAALAACRAITDAILPGLDATAEIEALSRQGLGETVLLLEDGAPAGFAICHVGPGTEAGSGMLFVKFAAARPGPGAAARFAALMAACEGLAATRGVARMMAGVNAARRGALDVLRDQGFAQVMEGVAMQRQGLAGFNRADCFVADDWR